MTSKVYKTAQGKSVDLGTIMLQNEHVRAVGNMGVNARGDKLDSNNQVIDTKPRQIQRQTARTTNVSSAPVQTSGSRARRARKSAAAAAPATTTVAAPAPPQAAVAPPEPVSQPTAAAVSMPAPALEPELATPAVESTVEPTDAPVAITAPPVQNVVTPAPTRIPEGGLAGAIARQREIKQELDKTRRQQAQAQGVRKI